ncbi:hypothetical protein RXV95_08395 [Novosphingobium sp. ZN18A2]|uniref:hypothetical protein n=1 Tax=Novosphingobium sp. ZN18A2 TaxID=3079861 RepID=UPI0030D075BF
MRIPPLLAAIALLSLAACSKGGSGGDTDTAGGKLPADFKLTSASIEMPDGAEEEFPAGPDVDAMNNNCRACHSPSMVLVQPPLTRGEWTKTVDKMRHTFMAPVPDSEVPKILNYLDDLSTRERAKLADPSEGNT